LSSDHKTVCVGLSMSHIVESNQTVDVSILLWIYHTTHWQYCQHIRNTLFVESSMSLFVEKNTYIYVDVRVMLWIYYTTHWWLHISTVLWICWQYCICFVDSCLWIHNMNCGMMLWIHNMRMSSLLWVSFAKETCNFKEPTKNSHSICVLRNHVVTAQEWTNRTLIGHEPPICSKMCFTKTELVQ